MCSLLEGANEIALVACLEISQSEHHASSNARPKGVALDGEGEPGSTVTRQRSLDVASRMHLI